MLNKHFLDPSCTNYSQCLLKFYLLTFLYCAFKINDYEILCGLFNWTPEIFPANWQICTVKDLPTQAVRSLPCTRVHSEGALNVAACVIEAIEKHPSQGRALGNTSHHQPPTAVSIQLISYPLNTPPFRAFFPIWR